MSEEIKPKENTSRHFKLLKDWKNPGGRKIQKDTMIQIDRDLEAKLIKSGHIKAHT